MEIGMSEHNHQWRRITEKINWSCTDLSGCRRAAVWCCGKQPLIGDRECWAGRCAKHGPKPKTRKPTKRGRTTTWRGWGVMADGWILPELHLAYKDALSFARCHGTHSKVSRVVAKLTEVK